jgi:hypothetical protein
VPHAQVVIVHFRSIPVNHPVKVNPVATMNIGAISALA